MNNSMQDIKLKQNKITQQVAVRVKQARIENNYTQQQIAKFLGVSFQQVQKYESGLSSISINKLILLANSLNLNISYFFKTHNK